MVEGEATKAGLTLGLALRNAACLNSIEELAVVPSAVAFLYVVAAGGRRGSGPPTSWSPSRTRHRRRRTAPAPKNPAPDVTVSVTGTVAPFEEIALPAKGRVMVEGEATKAGLTLGLALRNAACLNSIEELAVVPSAVAFLYVVAAGCVGILWSQSEQN